MCDHARVTRCPWSTSDPLYVRYHDEEWEFPERDFTFVGPTICYAYMQAVGMVDDHLVTCFRRRPG